MKKIQSKEELSYNFSKKVDTMLTPLNKKASGFNLRL